MIVAVWPVVKSKFELSTSACFGLYSIWYVLVDFCKGLNTHGVKVFPILPMQSALIQKIRRQNQLQM